MTTTEQKDKKLSQLALLLKDDTYLKLPKLGDVIKGTVISASNAEIRLDIDGVKTGVVRGRELYNESEEYGNLKPGDTVEATVIELENENGELELSFKYAGLQKAWDTLRQLMAEEKVMPVKINDANKGGIMVKVGHVVGFLPVSQLTPEHYPRVEGGDKNKILEILKSYIGKEFNVKVIDVDEREKKLIVSEKAAWEEDQQKLVARYKVGDSISGKATAVTDFGVFVEFDDKMEGLVHISELAWQRIDNPRDFVKVGDPINAEIINIDGTKIFLSMKKLLEDPWKKVSEKYKVGDIVKGTVLKTNPFGLFVELDEDIHGLAHVSELSTKPIANVDEIAKSGDVIDLRVISIEPAQHRLGLSIKALKEKPKKEKEPTAEAETPTENQPQKSTTEPEAKAEPAEKEAPKESADETSKESSVKESSPEAAPQKEDTEKESAEEIKKEAPAKEAATPATEEKT